MKLRTIGAYREALFEAMVHRFYEDPTMVAYGEENRDWGGAFESIADSPSLPYHRLFNSPISEGAIVGSAVGYALCGGRAVAELMYCDFMGRAGDEIFNQMAKWQSMSAGILKMPLVLRVSVGSKYGAQHSQDWTSIPTHIPGLKVMFPATPYDAKGMLNLALRGTDPVVFFESQRLYDRSPKRSSPKACLPRLLRSSRGRTLHSPHRQGHHHRHSRRDALPRPRSGRRTQVEVRSRGRSHRPARFLNPLNYEPIAESVRKTGRCVLVPTLPNARASCTPWLDHHPDGFRQRTLHRRRRRSELDHPPAEMEEDFFPQKEWILDVMHERILPLPGHEAKTNPTIGEMNRTASVVKRTKFQGLISKKGKRL